MKAPKIQKMRHDAIKELIAGCEIEGQQQLVDLLQTSYGIATTQAMVSRDLRQLGIDKRSINNKTTYVLSEIDPAKEILQFGITDIQHNKILIVIKTLAGMADFVGDFLDNHAGDIVMGTISGENTVFVTPLDIDHIQTVYTKICSILYFKHSKWVKNEKTVG